MAHIPDCQLPGTTVCRLMRKHGVTIRSVAEKYRITMNRVREVRANGVTGFAASEWHYMITDVWLDDISSQSSN